MINRGDLQIVFEHNNVVYLNLKYIGVKISATIMDYILHRSNEVVHVN